MTSPTPRGALAGLSLCMLLAALGTSIANVGLPQMAEGFTAAFAAVQWVVLSYLLAITAVLVGVGRLGDRFGHRRLLLAGVAVFAVACALCSAAPSLGALVAARALQGLGAATMMAMTMALVTATVPKEQTGRVMGLLGTMSAVGTGLGPAIGGALIAASGWRALFLVMLPLAALAFVLVQRTQADRDPPPPAGGRVSVFSALHDRALGAGLGMSTLVAAVMMTTLVAGPFYLSHGLGLDPTPMGLAMAVGPCVAALAGIPAGRLTDRWGSYATTLGGLLCMLAGCLMLVLLPLGAAGYIGALVILTLGYAHFQAANNTAVMSNLSADRRGVIAGWLNLSRNLGLIIGAWALGAVFAWGTGDLQSALPAAVGQGLRVTFAVAAGLVVLALLLALGRQVKTLQATAAP
ncbi:MFS transporter [Pseudomonas fluorescens]|jgi:MFS family permease|uniref:MFS transporter n=1 Tax=Pseudomonas TaxID=286 RepID=UPI0007175209|nr:MULTISPECIES: MFS transporter [Pseudomonas]AYG07837.1 MFS transporter [Pseudomonas fluorescens]MBJ2254432.1 MFS transporter [Pseudomonas sp. MF6784]MBJ2292699.1 MFS transporter [Pseudomonas sp. MF5691]MBK3457051.1 MFS transporter [Pseudomonas sp. MF6754]MDI3206386.1 MFS transporter [Pseudomonas shahriarae]